MRTILASLLSLSASVAFAATFTVTNTSDSGAGSLRQAILGANAASGADTIAFDVSGAECAVRQGAGAFPARRTSPPGSTSSSPATSPPAAEAATTAR